MTDLTTLADQPQHVVFGSALREILAGKRPDDMARDLVVSLVAYGLLESKEQTKPCRTCGTLQVDFRYWKLTPAGKLLAEATNV